MLRNVLSAFQSAPGPMSLDLLAAQLDLEPGVLEAMLMELVRMGRLVRIEDRSGSACAACGVRGRCPYLLTISASYYALPGMVADGASCEPDISPKSHREHRDRNEG